jgi:tetratricopeptide (TPR) repeat protein
MKATICTLVLAFFMSLGGTGIFAYVKDKDILKQSARLIEEGRLLFDQNDYYGAVEKWTTVIKADPWNEEAKLLIEKTLVIIEELTARTNRGFESLEGGDLEDATEDFRYVKDHINPDSRSLYALVVSGFNLIEEGRNRKRYRSILETGDLYLREGKLEEAERTYVFARKFFPAGGEVDKRLGLIKLHEIKKTAIELFDRGDYGASKEQWILVLGIDPNDGDVPLYLSKIDFQEREKERLDAVARSYFDNGVAFFNREQYQESIDQFENAVAMNYRAEEARRYIERARKAIAEREKKTQDKNTEQVAYYLREGIKYYNLNQYKKSLSVLNEGLKIDPENSQIREYMIRVIIALKREEEKDVPPSSPFYKLIQDLKRLGTEAYSKQEYAASVRYWEEILLIFPFNEEARLNLTKALSKSDPALAREILDNMFSEARDLSQRGKKREALIKLKLILDVDPAYKDAQLLAKELEAEKKVEEKRAPSAADKKKAQELYGEGLELYKKEKLEEASQAWAKAVELDPDFVDARVYLSRVESKLRNLAKASGAGGGVPPGGSGDVALDEDTRIKMKKHYLDGVNYYMNGMYREAITEWEEVLKIDPKNENVKQNIERARKRLDFGTEQGSS